MTSEEIFQLEHWLELGFQALLADTCPLIYKSREAEELDSPRIEIKAIVGKALNHAHSFADGTQVYDAYEGTVEITVVTNRKGEEGTMNHPRLLGVVRSRMSMKKIRTLFSSPVVAIDDLRATGTVDTFSDENGIDITSLSFYNVFNIKPSAWSEY